MFHIAPYCIVDSVVGVCCRWFRGKLNFRGPPPGNAEVSATQTPRHGARLARDLIDCNLFASQEGFDRDLVDLTCV